MNDTYWILFDIYMSPIGEGKLIFLDAKKWCSKMRILMQLIYTLL